MISNNDSNGRPNTPLIDIAKTATACGVVFAVIVLAIAISAFALSSIFPSDIMEKVQNGAPPAIVVWTNLIIFQIAASVLILAAVKLALPGQIHFIFALGPPRVPLSSIAFIFICVTAIHVIFSFLTFTFFPADVTADLDVFRDLMQRDIPFVLIFAVLVIGAPVCEELIFRGYLMNRLAETRLGFGGATIVSTTGWTLLHAGYSTAGLMEVFLAGLLFSWALWKTGSLWVPILFHAIYNFSVLMYLISTSPTSAV